MKTLIFDFDGTLVDSMGAYSKAITRILEDFDIVYPDDIIKTVTPLGYIGTAKYYIEQFGLPMTQEAAVARVTEYAVHAYTYEVEAKEAVRETLEKLKARGYSLNVLTASPHSVLDVCLQRNGIYELFDHIWSCDDFGTTKSDVKLYGMVAEALGVEMEACLFFDDNIHSLRTALTAGMESVGVYDDSSREYRGEIRDLCGKYIDSFREMDEVLE